MKINSLRRFVHGQATAPAATVLLLLPNLAQASVFQGETLDMVANIMSWVVLIVAPAVAIAVFWLVHILPEKIAEKRHHPQAPAIKTLCLLSLFFGGLLWPLAWLWAYSKPVLYKLAYGTDRVVHGEEVTVQQAPSEVLQEASPTFPELSEPGELAQLRQRVAYLESRLAGTPGGN